MVRRCRLINVAHQSRTIIVADTALACVPSLWQSLSSYITWIIQCDEQAPTAAVITVLTASYFAYDFTYISLLFFSTVLQVVSSKSDLRRWHDAARYGESVVTLHVQVWRRVQLS